MASLAWISGHWRGDFDGHPFEAIYTTPEGGTMLGTSKLYHEGRVVFFEFERFWVEGERVLDTPHPECRAATTFTLEADEPGDGATPGLRRAVFIDPSHDFPTRIVFEQAEEDRLVIELTGPRAPRAACSG